MRWLAVSLAAHGALFAAWHERRTPATVRPTSDRAAAEIDERAVDAMDVVLVTLAPAVVPRADAPRAASQPSRAAEPRRRAPARVARAAPEAPAIEHRDGDPTGELPTGPLAMRVGGEGASGEPSPTERVVLSIDGIAAAIAAAPGDRAGDAGGGVVGDDLSTGGDLDADGDRLMRPNGGGTYAHRRSTFRIDVARDGSVTIADEPNFKVDVGLPCVRCLVDDYEKWRDDPYGGHTVNLLGLLPVLRAGFDLTDWMERLAGNDPYSYEKARFLDATRERRARMSGRERRERMRDALAKLPDLLESVWTYEGWSERERRYVLFKLWDECDDSSAGAQARATILAFVRRRAPGYSAEELAALNAERASQDEFAP